MDLLWYLMPKRDETMRGVLGAVFLQLTLSPFGAAVASPPAVVPTGLTPEQPLGEFLLTHWSVDEGLLTSALTEVLQTSDGYLWIAAYDGLFRFDGVDFTIFDQRTVPHLKASGFKELAQDEAGRLWIGTQSAGVAIHQNGVFSILPGAPEPQLTIESIHFGGTTGTVWIGTTDSGVFGYRDEEWTPVDHPSLARVSVLDVLEDSRGTLWFAAEGRGVVVREGTTYRTLDVDSGLVSDATTSLCETAGAIWVGTREGLSRIEGSEIRAIDELAGVEIRHLYGDDYDNLWIVAEQGLIRRNSLTGEYELLEKPGGQPVRGLYGLSFDREGALWLASGIDGLYQLRQGKFENYSILNGLSSERANAVYELEAGTFLIGGDGGAIDVVRDGTVEPWPVGLPLPDVRVRDFLKDRQGRLWISSYAGLLTHDDGRWEWLTTDSGLPTNQVRMVFEDSAGTIWIGTRNGGLVERLPDGSFQAIDRSSGLSSNLVLSIVEGRDGELILGTREGVDILKPDGAIIHYGVQDGIPGTPVFNSLVDDEGALWLGTNGGLARLSGGEIGSVSVADGLPVQGVFDLHEDARGSFWLSTTIGVVEVRKQHVLDVLAGELEKIEAVVYDDRDGLVNKSCTGAVRALQASDGRLWFPTLGGVSVVDPEGLGLNPLAPPVYISSLIVDGRPIDLRGETGRIDIEPRSRQFEFRFAAPSLLAPAKVKLRYRLRGFDEDWVDAGRERTVRYTNLRPSDYAFEVVAANNDGVWSRAGATLDLRVRPAFYQDPWFRLSGFLVCLAMSFGLYRWRINTIRARSARLEKIIAEQRKAERANQRLISELEAKNAETERFNYTVSHDLKSPLVTIVGFLGLLRQDVAAGDLERMERDIQHIDVAVARMGRLLDELLALAQAGRSLGRTDDVDLGELAREAVSQLTGEIQKRDVAVEVAADLPTVRGEPTRLLQLFQNLIQNAVRHAGDGPRARVEVGWRRDREEQVFYVRDHGTGIDPRYHEKIFLLFERLDAKAEGTGVGLALVQRIVELHGGRVWVESEGLGQGSTFCFTLSGDPAVESDAFELAH